jgi:hypothetical protein
MRGAVSPLNDVRLRLPTALTDDEWLAGQPAKQVLAGRSELGPSYTPEKLQDNDHGTIVHLGGTQAGCEAAKLRDWPAVLRFVTDH